MIEHPIEGDFKQWVVNAFRQSELFASVDVNSLDKVASLAKLQEYGAGEHILTMGDRPEAFWMLLMGEAVTSVQDGTTGEQVEVASVKANEIVGELGMLLEKPRTESVVCTKQTYALEFGAKGFRYLMERLPGFSQVLSKSVSERLVEARARVGFPVAAPHDILPTAEMVKLIPTDAILKYRLIPIGMDAREVTVGFVDPPSHELTQRVRASLGDLELRVLRLRMSDFDRLLTTFNLAPPAPAAAPVAAPAPAPMAAAPGIPLSVALTTSEEAHETRRIARQRKRKPSGSHRSVVAKISQMEAIRTILERMPAANASDLHLSPGKRPRWRIDGDLFELEEFPPMGEEEALDLFEPVMPETAIAEFNKHHDCDFAFSVDGMARFRANVYRGDNGVGAVLRIIPMQVWSMEKLGLPASARAFCDLHQGLVLVCGPTGSGKSTTLAAMIDHVNNTRRAHVVTLEDPIEYIHQSRMALVTQREVGNNTTSFTRGLRASLREDPDIVLVGELRDRETLELALKTAQTGHLVFGTLHTSTAIGTVDRIIDMFPVDQHNQVRSVLADMLKGVISQHLAKRIGGGRVAAYEVLVGGSAVGNCIRQGKNHQIATVMTTNRSEGHRQLNDELWELVRSRAIEPLEALKHTDEKKDLKARLGIAA